MFNKVISFVKTNAVKISALSLAVFGSVVAFGRNAFAAVDTDVASTSASMATTLKENVVGVISSNIGTIVLIGAVLLGISIIWKLVRRFTGR